MQVPEEFHQLALETIRAEYDSNIEALAANQKSNSWAVVYGLIPKKDGDQWCVLLGEDLQEGIAAFGDTPEQAIYNFDKQMLKTR